MRVAATIAVQISQSQIHREGEAEMEPEAERSQYRRFRDANEESFPSGCNSGSRNVLFMSRVCAERTHGPDSEVIRLSCTMDEE